MSRSLTRVLSPRSVEASNAEAVDNPLHEAAKRGNLAFLKECMQNGVSVNALDKVWRPATPLLRAADGLVQCGGSTLNFIRNNLS